VGGKIDDRHLAEGRGGRKRGRKGGRGG
jgi:hypothetical protein